MLDATPIVVANLLVAAIAIYSTLAAPGKLLAGRARRWRTKSGA
jgi:hypothetical protein